MQIKKEKATVAAAARRGEALRRRSRGRRDTGGAQGGAARSDGGAAGCGDVRRSDGRPGALLCSVAPAIGAREEGGSGESGRAHQGLKHVKKGMESKRGVRRS